RFKICRYMKKQSVDDSAKEVARFKKLVAEFRKGILGKRPSTNMCFVVSAPLQGYLHACCGVDCELESGMIGDYEHFWLRLQNGLILDPTADQFMTPEGDKMPEVYVGE